jgi:hypothetical protein
MYEIPPHHLRFALSTSYTLFKMLTRQHGPRCRCDQLLFRSHAKSFGVVHLIQPFALRLNCHCSHQQDVCVIHSHAVHHIRKLLSEDTAKIVASSIVASRLDYCNSLLQELHRQSGTNFSVLRTASHASTRNRIAG